MSRPFVLRLTSFVKKGNLFLWITLAVFIAYSAWLVWVTARPAQKSQLKPQPPSLEISTVELNEVEGREKIWTLTAKRAKVEEAKKQTYLEEASGLFYRSGQPLFKVVCPRLAIDYNVGEVTIEQARIEYYEPGRKRSWQMTGDKFFWRSADRSLRGQGRVTARDPADDLTLKTQELEFDQARGLWRLEPRVEADWRDVAINGGAGVYRNGPKLLAVAGPVTARRGSARAACGRLEADLGAQRIEFRQGVDLADTDLTIKANSGYYLIAPQRIVLTGDCQVMSQDWQTSGQEVSYDLPTQKLKIAGQGKVVIKP